MAREVMQDKLRGDYQGLVEKLEKGRVLTAEDQTTLELLIIGVARTYLQMESDFPAWKTKVDRLARELEALQASSVDSAEALLHVQGICLEAKTVLPELTNYLRERERVERFENSIRFQPGGRERQAPGRCGAGNAAIRADVKRARGRFRIPRSDGIDLGPVARRYSRWEDRFFYLKMIEQYGQPVLDVGCATGRLLLDYLQNGIDIDGVDISPEMLALCTEKASKMGLSPALYQQAMENLELPRHYRTILVPSSSIPAHSRSRAGSAGNASPACPPAARRGAGDAVHAPLARRRSPGVRLGANERKGTTGRRSYGAQMVPMALRPTSTARAYRRQIRGHAGRCRAGF